MDLLTPVLQSYPWGSRTHLAELTGAATPSSKPWAELWFGAHPLASATIAGRDLDQVIAADPEAALGERGSADTALPFLLKLLAAAEPLSLQAHPTLAEAQEGFAREEEQGIAPTAHFRNYRDSNHKPELIVALTEFHALAGFRPVARTKELFAQLNIEQLDHYLGLLDAADEDSGLRALFTTWLTLPQGALDRLIDAVARACAAFTGTDAEFARVAHTTVELARKYPSDPGVLGAMLLNRLCLKPGEAIFLGAGQLHAYLSGMGVEIMANSDNVLRGGLTSKHVDVVELLRVLSFAPLQDPVLHARDGRDGWRVFPAPVSEFELRTRALDATAVPLEAKGAAIVLVTSGSAVLQQGEQELEVPRGHAAWVPANEVAQTFMRKSAATAATAAVTGAESVSGAADEATEIFVASAPQ